MASIFPPAKRFKRHTFKQSLEVTALASAAAEGKVADVIELLQTEDPAAVDELGRTALTRVCAENPASLDEVVKLLLADGRVDPNSAISYSTVTALMLAVFHSNVPVVQLLLLDERVDPNCQDAEGETALLFICSQWRWRFRLLRSSSSQPPEGRSQLEAACEIVQLLLEHKRVDPNMMDSAGQTALMHAAVRGPIEFVKLLLGNERVNPEARSRRGEGYVFSSEGDTALMMASTSDVVRALLADPRVDPNTQTLRSGDTALLRAARKGDVAIVKVLLEDSRVIPNLKNNQHDTALTAACDRRRFAVVKLLLDDDRVDPSKEDSKLALSRSASVELSEHLLTHLRPSERVRPDDSDWRQQVYDVALSNVKRRLKARFRGLVRFVVVLRRMRLRAAMVVYAPGGMGAAAAAASFYAAASAVAS